MLFMPQPAIVRDGIEAIDADASASSSNGVTDRVKRRLAELKLRQLNVEVVTEEPPKSIPSLEDDYSYHLIRNGDGVVIESKTEWGALAACSTLAQEIHGANRRFLRVEDSPKFSWRGLMIDVCRHFMSLPRLMQSLDLMAYYKLNVLHVHLTDDQGFRFGTERFPELVSDSYYSKQELALLVERAADLGIRVVPEFDVPGHVTSWLLGKPEWGAGRIDGAATDFGVHQACLDPSNPELLSDLALLWREAVSVFPDRYFHIGGDEVEPDWWRNSESIQAWAKKEQLTDERDIQVWFTNKMAAVLRSLDRIPVAWDEALHEKLAKDVVIQAWRGLSARDLAVQAGFRTIVSSPYYLDLNYGACDHHLFSPDLTSAQWREANKRMLQNPRLRHVAKGVEGSQDFGTLPELKCSAGGEILGGEGCMWSELVSNDLLHTRVWSRMPAIAERLWSKSPEEDEAHLYQRLQRTLKIASKIGMPEILSIERICDIKDVAPLIEMLEPIKWYSRVLGEARQIARSRGESETEYERPYTALTPLDRIVDRLPSDSIASRSCARDIREGRDLSDWIAGWRRQRSAFTEISSADSSLLELDGASDALCKLADVAEGLSEPDSSLAGPYGQYLLPIAYAFEQRDTEKRT